MSGARTLEDDDSCGQTATTLTLENVFKVEPLIKKAQKMAHAEIQDTMKTSSGSLTRILHDCLGVRKRCALWVPHDLSEEQKRGRVDWCTYMLRKFDEGICCNRRQKIGCTNTTPKRSNSRRYGDPDDNPPVKFKRNRSDFKQMTACFFAKIGHVATIPLEDRKTVTADWYVNHCLPKVFQTWCKRRPQTRVRGLLLHHDNASVHTAAVTLDFLAASDAQLVTQSPYSPDLVPCNWFLFPSVRGQLKGKQFQNAENAQAFFEGVI